MLDAIRHVIGKDFLLHCAQRRPHCGNLCDDVDAVAVRLDHSSETADLTLDALQALKRRGLGFGLHTRYIPLGGKGFKEYQSMNRSDLSERHTAIDPVCGMRVDKHAGKPTYE